MLFKNHEYFLMIVACGSLSKAADKLFLSQPSLSKYLSRLEKNLGIDLFSRKSYPLKLTYAGKLYHDYVNQVVDLEKQLLREFSMIRKDGHDSVSLGIGPWRGTCILPVLLPTLAEKHPGIDIRVLEGESDFLQNAILKNNVDFCITSLPINYENLSYEIVLHEKVLLVGNNEHPLVKKMRGHWKNGDLYPHLDILQLKTERFFVTTPGQNLARIIHDFFSRSDFRPKKILEIQNLTTAFSLVVQGMGFSFLPESALKIMSIPDNITFFTVGTPPLSWSLAAVYKKGVRVTKSVRLIIDILKELFAPSSS